MRSRGVPSELSMGMCTEALLGPRFRRLLLAFTPPLAVEGTSLSFG